MPPDSVAAKIFKQFTESSQNVGSPGSDITHFTVLILLMQTLFLPFLGTREEDKNNKRTKNIAAVSTGSGVKGRDKKQFGLVMAGALSVWYLVSSFAM